MAALVGTWGPVLPAIDRRSYGGRSVSATVDQPHSQGAVRAGWMRRSLPHDLKSAYLLPHDLRSAYLTEAARRGIPFS